MRVFFFPHKYLRDRHLDTIRCWDSSKVLNPVLAVETKGSQVSETNAVSAKIRRSWKQKLPLVNIKLRPREAPPDAVIYVWGALIATGKFIVDLDNPYSLVGYNPTAMRYWRPIIRRALLSSRCLQIRCISEACRSAVGKLYGEEVFNKAFVVYPRMSQKICNVANTCSDGPRFLFVGTQFLVKGGLELLMAFREVRLKIPNATLKIITHLPPEYQSLAQQDGVSVYKADLSRSDIWSKFMSNADVLVHPSYMESFGMVILEALSHGMAIIANDVYAHKEMVLSGENGLLLDPPLRYWNGGLAGPLFLHQFDAGSFIKKFDKSAYITQLSRAMITIAENPNSLLLYRQNSCIRFTQIMNKR